MLPSQPHVHYYRQILGPRILRGLPTDNTSYKPLPRENLGVISERCAGSLGLKLRCALEVTGDSTALLSGINDIVPHRFSKLCLKEDLNLHAKDVSSLYSTIKVYYNP